MTNQVIMKELDVLISQLEERKNFTGTERNRSIAGNIYYGISCNRLYWQPSEC